jgi:diacylglycerol kinase
MGLQLSLLETAILEALNNSSQIEVDVNNGDDNANQSKSAREKTAKDLAAAINIFVKSGLVTTIVTTTGSASAQTGTGTGYIS